MIQKKNNKVLAIILARTGSSRLKNKLFFKIKKKNMLQIFYERLKKSKLIDKIIIATTDRNEDDKIFKFAKKKKILCYRGSHSNVLKRFVDAYKFSKFKYDLIVRANADNTLLMTTILDKEIQLMKNSNYSLSTPFDKNYCPFGFSLVIFRSNALFKIYNNAKKKKYLEHIENYCFDHEKKFKILRPIHNKKLFCPELKLSLDTIDDYKIIKYFYLKIIKVKFDMQPYFAVKIFKEINK